MQSESSSGDEEVIMQNTMRKPCPTPIVDLIHLDDVAPGEDGMHNCDLLPARKKSSTIICSTSTTLAPEQPICARCPTCEGSFLSLQVEHHADGCAKAAWSGSEHLMYARLMADIESNDLLTENQSVEKNDSELVHEQDNCDPTPDDGSPADIKAELIDVLQTLQTNVNTKINRINVQQTSILDGYVDARKRCHWMHPGNRIRVLFIGEPAIDTGGPKCEFCSGK